MDAATNPNIATAISSAIAARISAATNSGNTGSAINLNRGFAKYTDREGGELVLFRHDGEPLFDFNVEAQSNNRGQRFPVEGEFDP